MTPSSAARNLCRLRGGTFTAFNYLLTYDSYGPVYNRFHRGEWITWASGGEGALETTGPLNGIERSAIQCLFIITVCRKKIFIASFSQKHLLCSPNIRKTKEIYQNRNYIFSSFSCTCMKRPNSS
jgi:hypothetical protein